MHPGRIKPLIDHLRALVAGDSEAEDVGDEPLLQLILTTHSPVVVACLGSGEGVFFESATYLDGSGRPGDVATRARLARREYQGTLDPADVEHLVTHGEVERYLATVGGE